MLVLLFYPAKIYIVLYCMLNVFKSQLDEGSNKKAFFLIKEGGGLKGRPLIKNFFCGFPKVYSQIYSQIYSFSIIMLNLNIVFGPARTGILNICVFYWLRIEDLKRVILRNLKIYVYCVDCICLEEPTTQPPSPSRDSKQIENY